MASMQPERPYKRTTRPRPLEERFWEKVDKSAGPDGCWPWLGTRLEAGYGVITPRVAS